MLTFDGRQARFVDGSAGSLRALTIVRRAVV